MRLKRVFLAVAMLMSFSVTVYASDTHDNSYKVEVDNGQVSIKEDNLFSETDNSELEVNVIRQLDDTNSTIFTGKLKDYDNGKWIGIDFSEIQFLVIVEWESTDNELIYIIPIKNTGILRTDDNKKSESDGLKQNTPVQSQTDISNVTYDVKYAVSNDSMNILYTVDNAAENNQTVNMIAALYKRGVLQRVITTPLTINADEKNNGSITMLLPENEKEECSVKMMVWESMGTLRPIGSVKTVKDIEPYLREKTIVVSADAEEEFNLYMNSDNVIGKNSGAEHSIKYDTQKFIVTDLCGFTYEKEQTAGKIENTWITIKSIDTQNGKIIFNFDLPEGRNTGINNIVKFRALSDVSGEEIIYEIQ